MGARGFFAVFAVASALLGPSAALAADYVAAYYYNNAQQAYYWDQYNESQLNVFLEQHPELTEVLGGGKVKIWRGEKGMYKIKYPNGASVSFPMESDLQADSGLASLQRHLLESARVAQLTPDAVQVEIGWLRDQLADHMTRAQAADAAVMQKLVDRIDAIKAPGARAGFFHMKPSSTTWLKRNYKAFAEIRDEAKVWGKELGFDVISFEDKLAADKAIAETNRFLKPVSSSDRAMADKVWDNVDGNELRGVFEKRGGSVKIAFEEPKWLIEPKGKMPGRAAVKATVTITRADGTVKTVEVVGKINTSNSLESVMKKDEWLKPFAEQFQEQVANDFVELDGFLSGSNRVWMAGAKVSDAVRVKLENPQIHDALEARQSVMKVRFEEPVWVVEPTRATNYVGAKEGVAEIRADISIVGPDGVASPPIRVSTQIKAYSIDQVLSKKEGEWLDPLMKSFQNGPQTALGLQAPVRVSVDDAPARGPRVAVEEAPADCDEAVDDVVQLLGK